MAKVGRPKIDTIKIRLHTDTVNKLRELPGKTLNNKLELLISAKSGTRH